MDATEVNLDKQIDQELVNLGETAKILNNAGQAVIKLGLQMQMLEQNLATRLANVRALRKQIDDLESAEAKNRKSNNRAVTN